MPGAGIRVVLFSLLGVFLSGCAVPSGESISHRLTYFVDPSGALDAAQVTGRLSDFKKPESDPPNLGFRRGNVWFHLSLSRDDFPSDPMYLQIEAVSLSYIDLFQDGRLLYKTGVRPSFHTKPVAHRTTVMPVGLSRDGPTHLLLKVRTTSVIDVPLLIWEPAKFQDAMLIEYAFLGMFIGVVLIMAGYNLFLAFAIKEKSYFLYVFYSLSIGLFGLLEDGLLQHFLRTEEIFASYAFPMVYASTAGFGLLFARTALNVTSFAPRLSGAMFYHALLSFFVIPLFAWPSIHQFRTAAFNLNFALVLIFIVWAIIAGILAGSRQARIFAAAFSVFITSAVLRILGLTGSVEMSHEFLRHGVKFGIAAELTILSLGLADRYNRLRDEFYAGRLRHSRERSELIGEVHDSIGSRLSAALMQVREGGTRDRIVEILQGALENARDITAILRLSERPEQTFEKDARDGTAVFQGMPDFHIDLNFDPKLNVSGYKIRVETIRVFQEWLNNCVRHGGARKFQVDFKQREGRLILRVKSDGTPFNWNGDARNQELGSGLVGIRARCRRIGAVARSRGLKNGRGTVFVLRTPVLSGS